MLARQRRGRTLKVDWKVVCMLATSSGLEGGVVRDGQVALRASEEQKRWLSGRGMVCHLPAASCIDGHGDTKSKRNGTIILSRSEEDNSLGSL